METIYQILRILHITAGMTAFFVAPVALATRKGGKTHVFWGRIFFRGMTFVAVSTIPMTFMRPNVFLFLVAVFSFHLSWSGYRAVVRRKAADPDRALKTDTGMAALMVVFYLALAGWGVHLFALQSHHPFGYVSLAFAAIGLRFSLIEIYKYYRPSADRMEWWYDHMRGMIGSYIAAVSAFSAVNFSFLPDALRWLWPTLIGVPIMVCWKRYYQKKFNITYLSSAHPVPGCEF